MPWWKKSDTRKAIENELKKGGLPKGMAKDIEKSIKQTKASMNIMDITLRELNKDDK
jgi:hypothetical protein